MDKLIKGIDEDVVKRLAIIGIKNGRSLTSQMKVAMEVFCDLYDSGKIK